MKKVIVLLCFSFVTIAMFGQSNGNLKKSDTHLITNKEYRQFTNWVRDSLAYRLLGSQIEDYVIYEDKNGKELEEFQINWRKKFDWKGKDEREMLDEMYLLPHERYYRKRELDTRRYLYMGVMIYPDTTFWINNTDTNTQYYSENLIKYYNWHKYFDNFPAQGVSDKQINCFLDWKTKMDKKSHKFFMEREEILEDDTPRKLATKINSDFWRITNKDYKEFMFWCKDSIAYHKLGINEGMEKYLVWEDKYKNPIETPIINWKNKINWNGDKEKEILLEMYLPSDEYKFIVTQLDWKKINFEYYFIDYKAEGVRRNELTDNIWQDRSMQIFMNEINVFPDSIEWQKKNTNIDFNLGFWDKKYDKELVAGISYEQAKAYYHWKIYKSKQKVNVKNKNPIGEMVMPTIEQWEQAMSGKEIKPVQFDIPLSGKQYFYQSNSK
ncbi:MAG: hypothetical protein ABIJ97_01830 [Bacteroidota bacterium]